MSSGTEDLLWNLMGTLFKAHPWHGVSVGENAPHTLNVFIEMVPTDTVKYEVDKTTGHIMLDRPQRYSNICPALYGFIPKTYADERVARLCRDATGREDIVGDGDPVDICVLTEKDIGHGEILLSCIPVGGFRMIDDKEADDKIIAVLAGDAAYGAMKDIEEIPAPLIDRLKHYFLTYKMGPNQRKNTCEISEVYGRERAHAVVQAGLADYEQQFGNLPQLVTKALRE
ncbi:MAG: inorganic pyrophosphatase [Myxococcota bacterium]